jgi:hypothetical protein
LDPDARLMRIGSYARPNPLPYYDCTSFSFLIVIMHYDDDDSFYFEEVDKLFGMIYFIAFITHWKFLSQIFFVV